MLRRIAMLALAGTAGSLAFRAGGRGSFRFAGRVVVITGGSRGLGLVMARELAGRGARLVLLARNANELERARAELAARGAAVLAIPCDIRDASAVRKAMQRAVDTFDRIDVLVNNAGIMQTGPVEHMLLSDFEDAMATNYFGAVHATLAVLPHLRASDSPRIVNISSIGGKIAVPHMLPYTASKFALVGFSDGLRAELMKDGIKVTTVCPGLMRTGSPIQVSFKGDAAKEFRWFAFSDRLPFVSMDARKAAKRIVDACARGKARLLLSGPTKVAAVADALLHGTVSTILGFASWLVLPAPVGPEGDLPRRGYELGEGDADSEINNELPVNGVTARA